MYRVIVKSHYWGFAHSSEENGYVKWLATEEVRTLKAARAKAAELRREYYKRGKTDCCDIDIVNIDTNQQIYHRRYGKENKNRPTRKADRIIIKDYPSHIDVYAEFGEDDEYGMDDRIMSIDITGDAIQDEDDIYTVNELIAEAKYMITKEQAQEIRDAIELRCRDQIEGYKEDEEEYGLN